MRNISPRLSLKEVCSGVFVLALSEFLVVSGSPPEGNNFSEGTEWHNELHNGPVEQHLMLNYQVEWVDSCVLLSAKSEVPKCGSCRASLWGRAGEKHLGRTMEWFGCGPHTEAGCAAHSLWLCFGNTLVPWQKNTTVVSEGESWGGMLTDSSTAEACGTARHPL